MSKDCNTIYCTVDAGGKILSCNSAFQKRTANNDQQSLEGTELKSVLFPGESEALLAAISQCLTNPQQPITLYTRNFTERNSILRWSVFADRTQPCKETIYLQAREDFTFSESMKLLVAPDFMAHSFIKNASLIGWITDEKGVMRYMSPAYCEKFRFGPEALNRSIYELFPSQQAVDYHLHNLKVLREGKAFEEIETAEIPGGILQRFKVFKFPVTFEGETMVGAWAVDLSDQMALQEELNKRIEQYTKTIERYHYVNEATSDAIYDWDSHSRRIYRGPGFETLFGYEKKESSLKTRLSLIHPEDREAIKKTVFPILRNPVQNHWRLQYRLRDAAGKYHYVLDKAFLIIEEGKVVRVIGALQDLTEQKELQDRLMQQEIIAHSRMVKSIIEVQEKERRQLSVELHDNVNQILASCKLMLEVAQANPDKTAFLVEKSFHSLQTAISEVHRISHNLNPSVIEDIGLVQAIEQLVEEANASSKVDIAFSHQGSQAKAFSKEEDRIAVYRIIQESINNIIRHSGSTSARIHMVMDPQRLSLTVKDNGCGFNPAQIKRGLGLRNIYNRVEYYNGKIEFTAQEGKGCRMDIELNFS